MTRTLAARILVTLWFLALSCLLWFAAALGRPAIAAPLDLPVAEEAVVTAPTLIEPAEGAVFTATTAPPLGVPTLRWQPVAEATRYNVQVSISSGFADPIVDATTYAASYTPQIALPDSIYYWRVRAQAGATWGPYSEVRLFSKDWCAGGTIFPRLLGPLDGVSIAAYAHDFFHWEAVSGAATYLFEIATDDSFSSVVYQANTIKPHHTPVKRLSNNRYYWRVTPIDHQKRRGQPSPVWSFLFDWNAAPQLLTPDDGLDSPFLPVFSWTAVEAAKIYQLEVSTQPDFGSANIYQTPNTRFTPPKALSNDQEYFWRVKAIDNQGTSSPYSAVRHFHSAWFFKPRLLTPLNNSIQRSYPFFSWTAVPGVERYHLQIDKSNSFSSPIADVKIYNAASYAQPNWKEALIGADYYWRVRGMDAQDNYTPWSDIYTFQIAYTNSPTYVYPPYYYVPDAANLPIHTDLTLAHPLFVWDTSHSFVPHELGPGGEPLFIRPDYYVLEVTSDPTFFTVNFRVETAGLAAAPTAANPFNNLEDGKFYYWRVRAMKGDVQMGTDTVWVTRIDRRVPQLPTAAAATPIHPADGFEAIEAAPVLGWQPVPNAARYRVQLSRTRDFAAIVDEALAQSVNYVPWQGRHEPIPFGTYWWRVRAEDGSGSPIGGWSETRHFNVSVDLVNGNPYDFTPPLYPSSILGTRDRYDPALTFVADSPNGPADEFKVGALHVMLDHVYNGSYNWVFAFGVTPSISGSVRYGLYIDADHRDGSGALADPLGKPILADSLYLPEYVLYADRTGDVISAGDVHVFRWNGSSWDPAQSLASIGGAAWIAADTAALQLLVPYTAIGAGSDQFVGSLAVTVFSSIADTSDGMRDSVPEQGATIANPAFVSDMLMPLYPFDTPFSNPYVHTELPSLRWRMPYFDSVDGYQVQVARDDRFTDLVEPPWETYESKTWPFFSLMPAAFHSLNAYEDNESYYWRVRIRHERYKSTASFFNYGPWSPAMRFKLTSRQVGSPTVSTGELALTTPSFAWQRVEAAAGYTLQIDGDANFSRPLINEKLDSVAYTPLKALPDGIYYWRVATRRSDKVLGQWTPAMTFTKRSLAPIPLAPIGGAVINTLPTFTWTPVLTATGTLHMAAPRYRLQLDDDPNFSSPDSFDTESSSFTPSKEQSPRLNKLADGNWYWRVAVIDAENHVGAYSTTQHFYKEYLRPVLVEPVQGQTYPQVPSLKWEPLDGAAYYEVRVANDENGVDRAQPARTDNASFTPLTKLTPSNLYWRVQMFDDDGVPGPSVDGRLAENTEPLYLPLISNVWKESP